MNRNMQKEFGGHPQTTGSANGVRWSRHALDRAQEMGLDPGEIEMALRHFTHSYPNPTSHPAGRVYVAGDYAVPIALDGTIMTILWAGRTGRAA